ncbi:MAG: hypothetical protein H7Y88_05750 [Phycisphaerales bacterium]|nr:hypothetical protein [Phycisphaerales bacterium]
MSEQSAQKPEGSTVSESPAERLFGVLTQHADRGWKAEETNSARLAARANLVIAGVSAVIGFRLFGIGGETELMLDRLIALDSRAGMFWVCWLGTLVCLGWALLIALEMVRAPTTLEEDGAVSKPSEPEEGATSSRLLLLPPEKVADPTTLTPEGWAATIFEATYKSFVNLQERNAERRDAVDAAQLTFLGSLLPLFVSIGLYTWVAYDARTARAESAEVVHVEPENPESRDAGQRGPETRPEGAGVAG